MIMDRHENFTRYFKGDLFQSIFEEIQSIGTDHAEGEFSLIGKDVYYKVLHYRSKTSGWITESHKKYVDIQIVLSGLERIRVYDVNTVNVKENYNPETDCAFYQANKDDFFSEICLEKGYFCAFFPQDVHQTQIADTDSPRPIIKLVFKANEKFFT